MTVTVSLQGVVSGAYTGQALLHTIETATAEAGKLNDPGERKKWQDKMADDKAQLAALQPISDPQFEAKFNQLFSSVHTDAKSVPQVRVNTRGKPNQGEAEASMMPPASLAPWSLPLGQELPTPATAQFWLRAYTWTTWGVALALLVGVGFNELYITKSTFGATWWSDYMMLLAWGFGAEATQASITDLVRG